MQQSEIQRLLSSWDQSLTEEELHSLGDLQSRRSFLKTMLMSSVAVMFSEQVIANVVQVNTQSWKTLQAVQLHMFPMKQNEPDALSINATAYLKSILEWPGVDDSDKNFIVNGVGWLNDLSSKQFKKIFIDLTDTDKEKVLRQIEKSRAGENWLSLIMLYLVEALLTAPVYGGNTNSQGWQWLQYQPGFPLPSVDKRYFKL